MIRRRRLGLVAALVAAASVAACSSADPWHELSSEPWTDQRPGAVEPAPDDPAGEPETFALRPATETAPSESPAEAVAVDPGLELRMVYSGASGVAARWLEIPGSPAYADALQTIVHGELAAHAASSGIPFSPGADAPAIAPDARTCVAGSSTRPAAELLADPAFTVPHASATLTLACEVTLASGTVLEQRIRIIAATAGVVTSDRVITVVADTHGAWLEIDAPLFDPIALDGLATEVVAELRSTAGALWPDQPAVADGVSVDDAVAPVVDRTMLVDPRLLGDGSAQFTLSAAAVTSATAGLAASGPPQDLLLTVAPDRAAALLSVAGNAAVTAVQSGAPLSLPAALGRGDRPVDCSLFACVAVTYDDGPGAGTEQIVAAFSERHSAATFYVLGTAVTGAPHIVAAAAAAGHEIANHSWNHPNLTTLTDSQIRSQITRTQDAVVAAIGVAPTSFRPPYGAIDPRVRAAAGLPAVLWSVDTLDWQQPDDATLLARAVAGPAPGGIVLLHDIHANTVRMTPAIVDGLLGRGFTLVTVSQLLG